MGWVRARARARVSGIRGRGFGLDDLFGEDLLLVDRDPLGREHRRDLLRHLERPRGDESELDPFQMYGLFRGRARAGGGWEPS